MKLAWQRMLVRTVLVALVACGAHARVFAREVVDMAGRRVQVPERMVGVNLAFEPPARAYLPPGLAGLPVLGGVYGIGRVANPEEVLATRPQVVLAWKSFMVDSAMVEAFFAKIGVPVVIITLDKLADWPAALRFTGQLLGADAARTDAQAQYVSQALAKVQAAVAPLAEKDRLRVYYAEGPAGLATDCHKSFHTEAIELAGGWNVQRCEPSSHVGMEAVSLEQVIAADPQLIIAQDPQFATAVLKDPRWQGVRAVRDGRVVAVPHWPMNWIDRPPSAMRALGIQWLAHLFYPQRLPLDLKAETRQFYRLFLHVDLDEPALVALVPPV